MQSYAVHFPKEVHVSSKSHTHTWKRKEWRDPQESFPSDPPVERVLSSQWTDDLIIDGGNHGPAVRRGLSTNGPDLGGDFWAKKRLYSASSTLGGETHFAASSNPTATGTPHEVSQQWIYPEVHNGHWPDDDGSSGAQMDAYGTTAIARTVPTKPQADLGSFLGELREGLPRAVGLSLTGRARARKALNAGDEYLNVEFGWKPLIRDVRAFARSVQNASSILKTYHAGSGVPIKRSYEWPIELDTTVDTQPMWLGPLMSGYMYRSIPYVQVERTLTKRVTRWFKAVYTYYVPPPDTPERYLSDANQLLGAKLTPNMLWNIAPWTWAADWVSNAGDIAANLTYLGTDNLVIHHAYVMERTEVTLRLAYKGSGVYKSHPEEQIIVQEFTLHNKLRKRATPYGFGLNWDGFTPKQLAILGALAISRT